MGKATLELPVSPHTGDAQEHASAGSLPAAGDLECLPLLALRLDAQGIVRGANRQARQWLGESIIGLAFADCLVDFLAPGTECLPKVGTHQLTIKTASGLPETLNVDVHPLPEGGVLALAGVDGGEQQQLRTEMLGINRDLNDLTRRLHQMNAELRRLNELKNHFLGMAAHDLRRPLGVVLTYAEFLRDEAAAQLNSEHQDFIRTIHNAAGGMKRLVDQFLDVAVIEAGKLRIERRDVDLANLFEGVLPYIRLLAERKSVMLHVNAATGQRCALDPDKIGQTLVNLLANAVEHSESGRRVWLDAETDSGECRITVRDEGSGIAPDVRARLFEAFAADGRRKTAGERSTGLGLAIAKLVVQAHGGRIRVESVPGQGSAFTLVLPMNEPETGAAS